MREKPTKSNRFVHIITTSYRALRKARDFYVRSMLDCASANAIGLQGLLQVVSLPRSFSAAASARSTDLRLDLDSLAKEERKVRAVPLRTLPPRSINVEMRRIDEEKPNNYF